MTPSAAAPAPSRLSLWAPVAACMALIFALSSMSSPPAPPNVWDKLLHGGGYGVLALVTLRATSGGRLGGLTRRTLAAAWIITTAYGASDELHQAFVPRRSADVLDVVADAAGAAAALGAAHAAGIILRSRGAGARA
jgi:VanZ family protein